MSCKIEFSSLGANLSEIIYALRWKADNGQLNLYASSESSVSFQGTAMGIGYKVFDKCIKWVRFDFSTQDPIQAIENIMLNQFQNAIKSIHLLKCKYVAYQVYRIQKAIPHHSASHEYLIAEDESDPMMKIDEIRNSVKSFFSAVHLFWRIILGHKHEQLTEPIKAIVAKAILIHDHHIYISLSNLYQTIHLEGVMRERIPIIELAKLLSEQRLTSEESGRVRSWISKINRNQTKIDPHEFECVLKDIAEIITIALYCPRAQIEDLGCVKAPGFDDRKGGSINQYNPLYDRSNRGSCASPNPQFVPAGSITLNDSYVKLLLKLDQLDCNILHLNDPIHIHEREQLHSGTTISCNGNKYSLWKQISPEKLIDKTKVFTLSENDGFVVKVSNNRFELLLESQKAIDPSEHWGIKLVDTMLLGLDSRGYCVIQEKLHTSLSQHEWTSNSSRLNDQDHKIAMIIANHLMCWQQADSVPADLHLSHLMFDSLGTLKSLKLLRKETGDYGKWEDFAFRLSKGNIHVLNYIMRVSRLFEHNVAKYYRIPIIESIRTGAITPPESTIPMAEKYKSKLLELSRRACNLAKECFTIAANELSRVNRYSPEDALKLKEEVFGKLAALYGVSPTAGLIDDQLKDLLIAEYKKDKQASLYHFESRLANEFKEKNAYYQKEYEQMMTNNKLAQNDEDDVKI